MLRKPRQPKVTKETFRKELEHLVANFAANDAEFTSTGFTETQARTQFITPMFRALGWDIENKAGKPSGEMDVLEERGPDEMKGRPDYTFRIGGLAKFFVEAKAPHEQLISEKHVMQVKNYAWSTRGVFAVILTDFQEFRFFDASLKPDPNHPEWGLQLDLLYTKYLDNVDKLWEFSRQRVAEGSIEALLPKDKRSLRLRKPVDDSFLEDMTEWRTDLARAVHKANPAMDARTLTDVVQRLLDRLIFIRVAEDRRIVEKNKLLDYALDWEAIGGREPLLPRLNELFHDINEDFNGEIFKYHLCEEIKIDNVPLHRVIKAMYPPKSSYRFDAIPVDIFGAVYERYLGKEIHVKGAAVQVDDKPEVRKAGGVYYTPKYIVDYIVKNTVGKVIEGKKPQDIEKIRILDPACGSGSFLLGAYQYLIDYHVAWYEKHPREARKHPMYPELIKVGVGSNRLSIHRKAKILRNNLHGVDLDPQAVEITMMNLYLKALEGEHDLPHKQHLLPELKYNIRCGNSLIAPDIAKEQELSEEELRRINPFDWNSETDGFGDIMKSGGFHAVIGNPPYLFITEMSAIEKVIFQRSFETYLYRYDVYGLFVEKAVRDILRPNGILGFITPHTLLSNDSFEQLRRFMLSHSCLQKVVDIGPGVFQGVKNETMILIAERNHQATECPKSQVILTNADSFPEATNIYEIAQSEWLRTPKSSWQVKISPKEIGVVNKLLVSPERLGNLCHINQGLRTGNNERFLSVRKKSGKWKPAVGGKDIVRYKLLIPKKFVQYEPKLLDAPRRKEIFESEEKLVVQEIRNITLSRRIVATYDSNKTYCLQSTNVVNLKDDALAEWSIKYVLGVLNSKSVNFFFRKSFPGNNHIASYQLAQIPMPSATKRQRVALSGLVENMLILQAEHEKARNSSDRSELSMQVQKMDARIDELVYKLYKLSKREQGLIEVEERG